MSDRSDATEGSRRSKCSDFFITVYGVAAAYAESRIARPRLASRAGRRDTPKSIFSLIQVFLMTISKTQFIADNVDRHYA